MGWVLPGHTVHIYTNVRNSNAGTEGSSLYRAESEDFPGNNYESRSVISK